MKTVISLTLTFVLGVVVSGIFFNQQMGDRIVQERRRTDDALLNLSYEIMAHEEDVGLLKRENHTLRMECTP